MTAASTAVRRMRAHRRDVARSPAGATAIARRPHPLVVQRREQLRARRPRWQRRAGRSGRPAPGHRAPQWSCGEVIDAGSSALPRPRRSDVGAPRGNDSRTVARRRPYGDCVGVVRRATAGRWAVALAGTVAIGLLPDGAGRAARRRVGPHTARIVAAARDSATISHEGYVETTGTLGLPDLPRLGEVAALLGGTTHARVWWRSPTAWRVDRVTATGESGTYAWRGRAAHVGLREPSGADDLASSSVRLPRVDDLLPPQASPADPGRRQPRRSADPTARQAGRGPQRRRRSHRARIDGQHGGSHRLVRRLGNRVAVVIAALSARVVERGALVALPRRAAGPAGQRRPDDRASRRTCPTSRSRCRTWPPPSTSSRRSRCPTGSGRSRAAATWLSWVARPPTAWGWPGSSCCRCRPSSAGRRWQRPPTVAVARSTVAGGSAVLVGTPLLNAVIARGDAETGPPSTRRGRSYLDRRHGRRRHVDGCGDGAVRQPSTGQMTR